MTPCISDLQQAQLPSNSAGPLGADEHARRPETGTSQEKITSRFDLAECQLLKDSHADS